MPNFKGHYINFGFWKNISLKSSGISLENRILSSQQLYQVVTQNLEIETSDTVLEIGCGRGIGAIDTYCEYRPHALHAIDATEEQIARAKQLIKHHRLHKELNSIIFNVSKAESLPFSEQSVDKIYTIEAIQHFEDIKRFIQESSRVLRQRGRLGITSFFATKREYVAKLADKSPLVKDNIESFIVINELFQLLEKHGFQDVNIQSIGEHVFEGYEKWITQSCIKTPFSHNMYQFYQAGLIDYYVITANKKDVTQS